MTRAAANRLVDAGTLTWGVLKTALRCEMGGPTRQSAVNPGITHEQGVAILAAGIDHHDDAEIVAGPQSKSRRLDYMTATNVIRECHEWDWTAEPAKESR